MSIWDDEIYTKNILYLYKLTVAIILWYMLSHIIMPNTLSIHSAVCHLYHNKEEHQSSSPYEMKKMTKIVQKGIWPFHAHRFWIWEVLNNKCRYMLLLVKLYVSVYLHIKALYILTGTYVWTHISTQRHFFKDSFSQATKRVFCAMISPSWTHPVPTSGCSRTGPPSSSYLWWIL